MSPPPDLVLGTPPPVRGERASLIVRAGIASIWFLTGVLVLHPTYRQVGGQWLDRIGMPHWLMFGTCAAEVLLALWIVLGRQTALLCGLQAAMVLGFTTILAVAEPMLLVHPFGMLSKNLPLLLLVATAFVVEREGWTPRAVWLLRVAAAVPWVTEGLLPKVLFQQQSELDVVRASGLVPFDAGRFLLLMGAAQVASGLLALRLRGRPLRGLLLCQAAALVVLPVLVTLDDPSPWVHPFGPLTKNLPILAAHVEAMRRAP